MANEKLKRYRSKVALEDVVARSMNDELGAEDTAYLRRTLSDLSGSNFSSSDQIKLWWEGVKNQCTLNSDSFRMDCAPDVAK